MNKPTLVVLAGCNGSGKSSFSNALTPIDVVSFDYDKYFLKNYRSLIDNELRDRMAHNMTGSFLEKSIENAIADRKDFCYETNFNSTPMFWPNKFKNEGYSLEIIFLCLDSVEEAQKRVRIRVENGGHYVPETEVKKRFHEGYENLDKYYSDFNHLHLFNSSYFKSPPRHIASIVDDKRENTTKIPEFLKPLIPIIYKVISN